MTDQNLLQSMMQAAGCSERMAQSLLETAQEAIGTQITQVERVEDGYVRVLRLRTAEEDYYLCLSFGNVISAIRAGDPKGPVIYREIE